MKTLSKYVFPIALFLVHNASAQGVFIENGFGFEPFFTSREDVTTIGTSVGYVFKGIGEIGFLIERASNDQAELNLLGVGPAAAVYPLRQRSGMPVTVRLSGTYEFYSFSGDAVDAWNDLGIDVGGSGWSAGAELIHLFQLSPTVNLGPRAGFSYEWVEVTADDGVDKESESEDNTVFSFGASLGVDVSPTSVFAVTPVLWVTDGETQLGISATIAFRR